MTKRILTSQIKHETNTFSILPTTLDSYRARVLYEGADVLANLKGTNNEIAGVMDVAKEQGWELVAPVAADATPSGKVSSEAWAYLSGCVLDAIAAEGPFDGVLLSLHGAMVAEGHDDAEGDLLARVRAAVGPDVPVMATLDLHANVTMKMAENANALVSYRTYPHVDMAERGRQMAELLARQFAGEVKGYQTLIGRLDQLDGFDHGRTTQNGPMTEALAQARKYEDEKGIEVVSVNGGFAWADIQEAGPSVTVTYSGDRERARAIVADLVAFGWETKEEKTVEYFPTDVAIGRLKAAGPGDKPVVLADFSDNPGGGSYGDSPALLRAMVEAGLENAAFAVISDPEVASAAVQAGVGATLSMPLGGKFDPSVTPAFEMTGTVTKVSPEGRFVFEGPMMRGVEAVMGPSAVIKIGGVETVVITNRFQPYDRMFFLHFGIVPEEKSVVAVKSAQHFRAAFGAMAREVILVDAAGITSPDPKKFPYKNIRRPIWPLD
jgi:microcystin degradation protein MlrC